MPYTEQAELDADDVLHELEKFYKKYQDKPEWYELIGRINALFAQHIAIKMAKNIVELSKSKEA